MSRYDDWLTYDADYEKAEAEQEAIDARLAELLEDRDAVLEADSWVEGALDYDGLETALADLWTKDAGQIFSSNAWAHLMRMAVRAHEARLARLTERAEADVAEAAAFRPEQDEAA